MCGNTYLPKLFSFIIFIFMIILFITPCLGIANNSSWLIRKENQPSESKEVTDMTEFRHINMSTEKWSIWQCSSEWLRKKGLVQPRRICVWQDLNEWLTNKGSLWPKRICSWQDLNEWLTNKGSLRPRWLHVSICLLFELTSYEFPTFLIGWLEKET